MSAAPSWHDVNQRHLAAALARVREALARHAGRPIDPPRTDMDGDAAVLADVPNGGQSAIERLCGIFSLSPFERDVVLLCAGMELESAFAELCAAAQGDSQRAHPTFSLALAALPDAHWSALAPTASLRYWRLVEVGGGSLTRAPLRIDERILHYLAGVQHVDEHLAGLMAPVPFEGHVLVPSQREIAARVATAWSRGDAPERPVAQLCGPESAGKLAIAAEVCARLGFALYRMPVDVLPAGAAELDLLVRLWERDAALACGALVLDGDDADGNDAARERITVRFAERTRAPLFLTGRERRQLRGRASATFDVSRPSRAEQRALWQGRLGDQAAALNGQVDRLAAQFDLSGSAIDSICACLSTRDVTVDQASASLPDALWDACLGEARPRLDDLAQRIVPAAGWDDLVLPAPQVQTLRDVALHVRERARVYESWGFAGKGGRGLGISALFHGPSGTGKTMAAEVLARELHLDLYRIDLSQVVNKYIGETEKNLRRVFDAAEEGGAILLFDEADALFGRRTEVKDSHDRYANVEVSYLLQRMEAYRGLAILTTNMKGALDDAFLRRIRFVVAFPFPDAAQRAAIWRRVFPAQTPLGALDVDKLARLNVTGGNIRNIALNASFLAADAREKVGMSHLLRAARSEYVKLERPLTDSEIRGWRNT